MLRQRVLIIRMYGLAMAAGTVIAAATTCCNGAPCGGYTCPGYSGYGGYHGCGECCYVVFGPPLPSPIDTPLRCYFVPRRPAWGGQQYRYRVKPQEDFCTCGADGGMLADGCAAGQGGLAPELYDSFAPLEFEQFGQIPNTSPRDAGPIAPGTRQ